MVSILLACRFTILGGGFVRISEILVYLGKRLLMAILVLLIISAMVFIAVRLAPGDPVMNKIGPYGDSSPENYQRVAAELGLDKNIVTQYIIWIGNCLKLDFGVSLRSGANIAETVFQKLPVSFELIFTALLLALLISIPLGMMAAIHKGGIVDQIVSIFTTSFMAIPAFCIGLLMILIFSVNLKWLPSSGYTPFAEDHIRNLRQLTMPAITLALFETAIISKHVRSQTLDVIGSNYIRTAKAKGMSRRQIYYKHALRNILLTVVTVVGTEFASLFGGTVICEQVFGWSGLGWYIFQSVSNRDYPAVQASVLIVATIFVFINLLMDVIYTLIDPRVKLS